MSNWTIRQKLCLTSCVMKLGEDNWALVSKHMKILEDVDDAAEKFSQKNCARVYNELIESISLPKRRRAEGGGQHPAAAQLVSKLTISRIEELKRIAQQQQQQYKKLKEEIAAIERGDYDDELPQIYDRLMKERGLKRSPVKQDEPSAEPVVEMTASPAPVVEVQQDSQADEQKRDMVSVKTEEEEVTSFDPSSSPGPDVDSGPSTSTSDDHASEKPLDEPEAGPSAEKDPIVDTREGDVEFASEESHDSTVAVKNIEGDIPVDVEKENVYIEVKKEEDSDMDSLSQENSQVDSAVATEDDSVTKSQSNDGARVELTTNESHPAPATATDLSNSDVTKDQEQVEMELAAIVDDSSHLVKATEDNVGDDSDTVQESESGDALQEVDESSVEAAIETEPPATIILPNDSLPTTSEEETITPTPDEGATSSVSNSSAGLSPQISEEQSETASGSVTVTSFPETEAEAGSLIDERAELDGKPAEDLTTAEDKDDLDSSDCKICADVSEVTRTVTEVESREPIILKFRNVASRSTKRSPTRAEEAPATSPRRRSSSPRRPVLSRRSSADISPRLRSADTSPRRSLGSLKEAIKVLTPTDEIKLELPSPNNVAAIELVHEGSEESTSTSTGTEPSEEPVAESAQYVKTKEQPSPPKTPPRASKTISPRVSDDAGPSPASDSPSRRTRSSVVEPHSMQESPSPSSKAPIHSTPLSSGRRGRTPKDSRASHQAQNLTVPEGFSSLEEYKQWKRSMMMIWKTAAGHRHANVFLTPVTDEIAPDYNKIVFHPMDLSTIKKNIENGIILTTAEFQRELLLMFANAVMYNNADHEVHNMALEMSADVIRHMKDLLPTSEDVFSPLVGFDSTFLDTSSPVPSKSLRSRTRPADISSEEDGSKRSHSGSDNDEPLSKRFRIGHSRE